MIYSCPSKDVLNPYLPQKESNYSFSPIQEVYILERTHPVTPYHSTSLIAFRNMRAAKSHSWYKSKQGFKISFTKIRVNEFLRSVESSLQPLLEDVEIKEFLYKYKSRHSLGTL